MITYVTVYFGAALVVMSLVPVVSRLAKRYRLLDAPGLRKVHQIPVPCNGGSMFLGFLLGASSLVCQAKTSTPVLHFTNGTTMRLPRSAAPGSQRRWMSPCSLRGAHRRVDDEAIPLGSRLAGPLRSS